MQRMIFIAGLILLLSVESARGGGDDLKGDPIDPEATINLDLPEGDPLLGGERAAGDPEIHWRSVPNVFTGQRIPLPRAADGTCRDDVVWTIAGGPKDRVEWDPDGLHWKQHDVTTRVAVSIDSDTCELVVDEAIGRDHVRKRVIKQASPALRDKILGNSPRALSPQSPDQAPGN